MFGDSRYYNSDGGWNQCHWFDTMVSAYYPPNVQSGNASVGYYRGIFQGQASSQHPGGCNFAFADGSVRFVKNSINSWIFDPTTSVKYSTTTISTPLNVTYVAPTYILRGQPRRPVRGLPGAWPRGPTARSSVPTAIDRPGPDPGLGLRAGPRPPSAGRNGSINAYKAG